MAIIPLVRRYGTVLTLCSAGALAVAATNAQQVEPRSVNQQTALISVVTKKGDPVASLTPADLTIKEDGRSREVLKVERATGPMEIALLVDTSTAATRAIPDLRAALKAFSQAIWAESPDSQIALYSFGDRPALEADYSQSALSLDRRIDRLFAGAQSGSYFIDAVVEAAAGLRKRKPARPVLVAFVDENGPEMSNQRGGHAYDAVAAARASLWTVSRQGITDTTASSSENRERAIVTGDVTERTGGRGVTVFGSAGLTTQLTNVATQLLAQFVVTYGRVESLIPPEKLEIKLTNSDLRLAAPQWTTR